MPPTQPIAFMGNDDDAILTVDMPNPTKTLNACQRGDDLLLAENQVLSDLI